VLGLKKMLRRGKTAKTGLPQDIQQAISDWQESAAPNLTAAHYRTRYVVLDLKTSGFDPAQDQLLGMSAIALREGGCIIPGDAIALDFSGRDESLPSIDRQLTAFLHFTAKAPLVCYHWAFIRAFLERAYKAQLGIDLQPPVIDLAWLLPAVFDDMEPSVQPLDTWLERFGMAANGRRDAMDNTLALARLMQRLLARASDKGLTSAARLIEETTATSHLRRTY
jgi:DNA polymerase-3 subunit epsilon